MTGRGSLGRAARLLCAAAILPFVPVPALAQTAPPPGQTPPPEPSDLDPSAPLAPLPDIGVDWPDLNAKDQAAPAPATVKGQAIAAFVSLERGNPPSKELKEELRAWVAKEIGALARPDDIRFTEALPKTRSGKIMRRLLRELAAHGEVRGDITTLEDFTVIARLREAEEG